MRHPPSRTNSRKTRMEAPVNPLLTSIIRSEPMNDNAEAKRLRAEAVIASHPPHRIVIYEI